MYNVTAGSSNQYAQFTKAEFYAETGGSGSSTTYTVTYNANDATSGTVPTDENEYDDDNNTVTVLGNTGGLAKTHYTFGGWNTKADGTGTNYTAGNTFTISANTTLYAKWNGNTNTVTLPANDTYGTYTMGTSNPVAYGTTVELTYTPASGYESYVATWSVNGTPIVGNTFPMPDEAVTVTVSVAEVVDYATLPFSWDNTSTPTGITNSGVGTYASSPYLKFDGTGDYIILKINEAPGTLTFKIKGNSFSGGTFKMQTSADGITYTDSKSYTSLGDTQTETFENLASTVRYIKWVYTSKNNGNVALGAIQLAKYVEKYAITVAQPAAGGTIAADKTEAEEGATITLTTPTIATHYTFTSWSVYKTGEPATTVSVSDENKFNMPAYPVTVSATFTPMTVRTITIPAEIEDNVIVDAESNQAYAGDEVTITVDAPTDQLLLTLTVTGDTTGDAISISPAVSSSVDEYTFTMPDEDVTIAATFGSNYTVQFSENGTINSTETVTAGNSVTLPSATAPTGYTFAGWTADATSTATILTGSYTPSANVTLYAVYEKQESVTTSMTIDKDTENFPTSYGDANTFTEYELNGKKFKIQQVYVNSGKLQFRASGNSSGTGIIYNNESFGTISSIVLNYNSSDTKKNFTIAAGSTANPTSGTEITPTSDGSKYTFDLSGGSYSYFVLTNGENAGYLDNIVINYSGNVTVHYTLIKDITSAETLSDIYSTYLVTVKNNGVLTLTGSNNGTAANLIIEDGGQLIHNNAVDATLLKNITAYHTGEGYTGEGNTDGWYTIASPVHNAPVSIATVGTTYDLYSFNESAGQWYNQKAHDDFTTFAEGKGYLYANSANQTLSFAGSMKATNATVTVPMSFAGTIDAIKGFNLVGNPFTRNLTNSDIIKIGDDNLATYYYVAGGKEILSTTRAEREIKPGEGFLVQVAADQNLVFNYASKGETATKPAYIRIEAGNESFMDRAYVQIGQGNTLRKMTINDNVAHVCVLHNGNDYAAATIEATEGEMPVNFKAAKNGTYTLTVNAEGVKMNYLHLIDNMTGTDVDLLANPSYSFTARTTDYETRFRLLFSAANGNEDDNEAPFAYVSNGEIIITGADADALTTSNASHFNASLQVVDVLGHICRDAMLASPNQRISIASLTPGVYVLRLIDGNKVRTQKMVVR